MMWHTCQLILRDAYRTGAAAHAVTGVWHTIGTHLDRRVYVVKHLGEMGPREGSVLHLRSPEARLPEDVIRMGARETPDPEEYIYMPAANPPRANGCH